MKLRVSYIDADGGEGLIKPDGFLPPSQFEVYQTIMHLLGLKFSPILRGYPVERERIKPVLINLRDRGVEAVIDASLVKACRAHSEKQLVFYREAVKRIQEINSREGVQLFEHQEESILFLAKRTGAILAEPMGLGKTACAIIAAPSNMKILVICPSTAKGVWIKETKFWRPDLKSVDVIDKRHKKYKLTAQVTIVSQDSLPQKLEQSGPVCVIIDEAQAFKNYAAARTRRARSITSKAMKNGGVVWPTTGTPVMNNPKELWSLLVLCGQQHKLATDFDEYVKLFQGWKDHFGVINWGSPTPEMVTNLKEVVIRHNKRRALPNLPPKRYQTIPVEINKTLRKELDKYCKENGLEQIIEALDTGVTFTGFSKLRKAIATAKIPTMLSVVEEYEEAEEPLIVASAMRPPIDALKGREGWRVITGDTSSKERSEIADSFQRGELKGIGITIKAAGVALTLTYATDMLFVDKDVTPGNNDQCEDRNNRIGQTSSCLYKELVLDHPLDQGIHDLLRSKAYVINKTMEGIER